MVLFRPTKLRHCFLDARICLVTELAVMSGKPQQAPLEGRNATTSKRGLEAYNASCEPKRHQEFQRKSRPARGQLRAETEKHSAESSTPTATEISGMSSSDPSTAEGRGAQLNFLATRAGRGPSREGFHYGGRGLPLQRPTAGISLRSVALAIMMLLWMTARTGNRSDAITPTIVT